MTHFKRQATGLAIGGLLFAAAMPAQALSLLDAYSLALDKDPTFLAAVKEKEAGDENKNIGMAGLLPKVSVNYQNSPRNWQKVTSPSSNFFTGETIQVTNRNQYSSYAGTVTLTQPLIDYEAYARYRSGVAQTLMSDQRYRSKVQDLAVRLVTAYVDVVYAQDQILLAQAQQQAYREQLALNERLFKAGEGTVTDVSETQARYSLAEAQVIEANDVLDSSRRTLELMIGAPLTDYQDVQLLKPGSFKIIPLVPSKFEEWERIALNNNPDLAASRHNVDAAKYEVERNRAGYFPTVQLYASHSENDSSSDNTVNQKYRTNSVGVQVNMNLYSGGGVSASTRQAAARYGQAMYEMDSQAGNVINDLRKQYNLSVSSHAKLAAYEFAVQSATTQVEATRKSVIAGQRVNVDVLNAEQQLFAAKRDLATAKYTYIKARVALLSDSGQLNEKDMLQLAQYFAIKR